MSAVVIGKLVDIINPKLDVDARRAYAYEAALPDGAFMFREVVGRSYMRSVCPCGCRGFAELPVERPGQSIDTPPGSPVWSWNGSDDRPTLSPSIHFSGSCGWHGWLQEGIWRSV